MANRWKTMETVINFILGGSKITTDGAYSHEIKRSLLLGRKAIINLDSILKSRDITLPTKFRLVKAMVFLVAMYGVRIGLWSKLSTKELMLLNCGIKEDSWESFGPQGDPTSPSWRKSVLNIHLKDWTDAEAETPIFWPPDVKNLLLEKTLMLGKMWKCLLFFFWKH